MLTHQFLLVLHHFSVIFLHKGLIHHPLEVLNISSLQSIGQPVIRAIQETLMFLLTSVDFMRGVARQLSELGDIFVHGHGSLFQILKLLL
jgi:hypothetical protein